jgi:hypothetical protein
MYLLEKSQILATSITIASCSPLSHTISNEKCRFRKSREIIATCCMGLMMFNIFNASLKSKQLSNLSFWSHGIQVKEHI